MKSSPRMICGRHHDLLIVKEYLDLYQYCSRICFCCRTHNPVLFTGLLARVTRWVTPGLAYHLEAHNSPMVFKGWSIFTHFFVLHCIVLYYIVLYCIVLYCIVLYCIDLCLSFCHFFNWPQCGMSFWLTLFHIHFFLIVFCVWFHIKECIFLRR